MIFPVSSQYGKIRVIVIDTENRIGLACSNSSFYLYLWLREKKESISISKTTIYEENSRVE